MEESQREITTPSRSKEKQKQRKYSRFNLEWQYLTPEGQHSGASQEFPWYKTHQHNDPCWPQQNLRHLPFLFKNNDFRTGIKIILSVRSITQCPLTFFTKALVREPSLSWECSIFITIILLLKLSAYVNKLPSTRFLGASLAGVHTPQESIIYAIRLEFASLFFNELFMSSRMSHHFRRTCNVADVLIDWNPAILYLMNYHATPEPQDSFSFVCNFGIMLTQDLFLLALSYGWTRYNEDSEISSASCISIVK